MNELHIHEVLRMMIETQKTYTDKADFVKDISQKFGSDVRFHACSDSGMDIETAYDFLISRGKISVNEQQTAVGIDPNMSMCDEDDPHHHH